MEVMDIVDSKTSGENICDKLEISESVVVHNTLSNSTFHLKSEEISNNENGHNILQNVLEISEKENVDQNSFISCASPKDMQDNSDTLGTPNFNGRPKNENFKDLSVLDVPILYKTDNLLSSGEPSLTVVKALKPLCADYRSDSESESFDSESDSLLLSANSATDISSEDSCDSDSNENEKKIENKHLKKDFSLFDLPPIEDLIICVPEDACVEIGTITSIVETLVVVESYKGTAALDLDTVLFLDCGKRTLGKVFDILGPVTEPVYTVRFNSQEQMKNLNIEKNLKVYYAPKTQHTNFVFMSEVLKNRGSDASWKDNAEAPPEFQDFSDDEQERLFKNKQANADNFSFKEQNQSKKRPYNEGKTSPGVFQTSRFRNPSFCFHRNPNIQRNPLGSQPVLPLPRISSVFPGVFSPIQNSPLRYNVPNPAPANVFPIPPANITPRPRTCFPSRFSGPPLPVFASLPVSNHLHNFQHPFHQQRVHGYMQSLGAWGGSERPVFGYHLPLTPPPPPPPLPLPPTKQDEYQT